MASPSTPARTCDLYHDRAEIRQVKNLKRLRRTYLAITGEINAAKPPVAINSTKAYAH